MSTLKCNRYTNKLITERRSDIWDTSVIGTKNFIIKWPLGGIDEEVVVVMFLIIRYRIFINK